jgi:polysaccharide pyruvyl transferase WcaK-like protein
MKIVVEPGAYLLENVGDVAMLQVTVSRLRSLWPDADIHVVTESPQRLPTLLPGTIPVLTRTALFADSRLHQWRGSSSVVRRTAARVLAKTGVLQPRDDAEERRTALANADLLVVSGMGTLNDLFARRASTLLNMIELAADRGVPVVMFGQGIGPAHNPSFLERLSAVLPRAESIAVRERLYSPTQLARVGVPPTNVRVTGDDAIELAYGERTAGSNCIGVNLRLAKYANVDEGGVDGLRRALQAAVRRLQAGVLAIPISHRHQGADVRASRALLGDAILNPDYGESLQTPAAVIEHIARCRVVVTGSYHGGVFALARGVPVVALVNSEYYAEKFTGLADMFGAGCEVVNLSDPDLAGAFDAAINRSWSGSAALAPTLLEAARHQVRLGREAYASFGARYGATAARAGQAGAVLPHTDIGSQQSQNAGAPAVHHP